MVGDFTDVRFTPRAGESRGVAQLVEAATGRYDAGLDGRQRISTQRTPSRKEKEKNEREVFLQN
mgnify:CR=1 FL=1